MLLNPPIGLTVTEKPDGSCIIEHRYTGRSRTIIGLSIFFLFWSFFCYLVTVHIIQGFRHPESLELFFAIIAIPLVLLMYAGYILCLYYVLWSLRGRTCFHHQKHALEITYRHPWHTRQVTIDRKDMQWIVQHAHCHENSHRIFQRDLFLIVSNEKRSYTLLWDERQELIEWLGQHLAKETGVEYKTEIQISRS